MSESIKRRQFLHNSALIAAVFALFSLFFAAVRTIVPALTRERRDFKIGNLEDLPINSFHLLPSAQLYIYRDHEGVRAVSAVCTHLGCLLDKTENGFQCPCHGSNFDANGRVLSGPAPRSLVWYKVYKAEDGRLAVDMRHRVRPDDKFMI